MRMKVVAVLVAATLGAVSAEADENRRPGRFMPAVSASFTGGLTDLHNSIGMTVGTHVAPLRLGILRFPVLGVDAGFAYVCDRDGIPKIAGTPDPCAGRGMAGLVQLNAGFELVLDRDDGELSLVVSRGHVVAGPFKNEHGLNIGISKRW